MPEKKDPPRHHIRSSSRLPERKEFVVRITHKEDDLTDLDLEEPYWAGAVRYANAAAGAAARVWDDEQDKDVRNKLMFAMVEDDEGTQWLYNVRIKGGDTEVWPWLPPEERRAAREAAQRALLSSANNNDDDDEGDEW